MRRLAELDVDTLALMHGPAFTGDCRTALLDLAADFDRRIPAASCRAASYGCYIDLVPPSLTAPAAP